MTSEQERLSGYIDTWKAAVDDVVTLLRGLDEEDWNRPTDLPGWDVRSVAAHLAHIESELCGRPQDDVDLPDLAQASDPTGEYTQAGVAARRHRSGPEVVAELEECTAVRLAALREDPPRDPNALPALTPGNVRWTWETLLRNRPLDVWMHEQDIRRAVGRPGGMDSAAAAHTITVFAMTFPYVVGKRVAPPTGSSAVLDVRGVHPVHLAVEIGQDGRAAPVTSDPEQPTVTLQMDGETFVVLAGGRRTPDDVDVAVGGDVELGRRILEAMVVTP